MISLDEISLLLLAAVIAVPFFKRLRLGAVLGYLALIAPAASTEPR